MADYVSHHHQSPNSRCYYAIKYLLSLIQNTVKTKCVQDIEMNLKLYARHSHNAKRATWRLSTRYYPLSGLGIGLGLHDKLTDQLVSLLHVKDQ